MDPSWDFGAAGLQDEVLIASYETFRNHAREVDGWGGFQDRR